MDLQKIKQLYLEKNQEEELLDQLDEVSSYDAIVTYYRSLGLDPYKLRGVSGKAIRDKIKQSPSFKAWAKIRWSKADPRARLNARENFDNSSSHTLIEVLKTAKKESKGGSKKCEVTFYGYPDKNSPQSDSDKIEAKTDDNFINPN